MLVNPFMLNPLDVTPHIGAGNRMIILRDEGVPFLFSHIRLYYSMDAYETEFHER